MLARIGRNDCGETERQCTNKIIRNHCARLIKSPFHYQMFQYSLSTNTISIILNVYVSFGTHYMNAQQIR